MVKIRLGVNIDHVATVRNARGESYPSPLRAAIMSQKCGADSITIHLREDRRHIKESDLKQISSKIKIPLNLEIALTEEMITIALRHKPPFICFVPEKRKEVTTEGGLKLSYKKSYLKKSIDRLKKNKSRISLFIEPSKNDILTAKNLGAHCVELHTGKICNLINKKLNYKKEFIKIKQAVFYAKSLGLEVHAGHGLTFESAKILKNINEISEFNIGHFLIGESIFIGLKETIQQFKKVIRQ